MTKSDLVREVSSSCEITQVVADEIITTTLDKIVEALVSGDDVKIKDFGNFVVKVKAARTGTNPGSGEKITIPESKSVKFRPAKALKERVK